ncbi:Alg9-like mannosyltransferase family-domain-containing protein [Fennellomyces sp. T-0311]|nr:Alg9-like mannosyltransferase family-domain-containing protein [Fennellomyces sp. T-0311]
MIILTSIGRPKRLRTAWFLDILFFSRYAHPIIFALIYKIVAWIHLDQTRLLLLAPKFFQATIAALTDYATYSLGKRIVGNAIAPYILFVTLCSWYNYFVAARTLSNTMEGAFTTIGLCYWPLPTTDPLDSSWIRYYRIALVWASLACVMRPTNALVWLFLGLKLCYQSPGRRLAVLFNAGVIVAFILAADIGLDTCIYSGKCAASPVWTPINFFKINVLQSISLIYGVHPWHWYISQGIPVVLTTMLPLTFYGYRCATLATNTVNADAARSIGHLILWVVGVYSLLSHKEFRFIYPVVPLMLIFVAVGLSNSPSQWRKLIGLALVLTQIPMALYLSLWHQRGVTDVMLWIKDQTAKPMSVGILMPCHSTPWQSVIHRPDIDMWFLTCEPPLDGTQEDYMDEADRFYADPVLFLSQEVGQSDRQWPTHLVMFENLLEMDGKILPKQIFVDAGYKECTRFFNSHFHDDWRRQGDVVVYCRP